MHWRRILYLRLPIDSVRHYRRYANISIFSKPHFPMYGQNPRTYTQKYVSEKIRITPYFTQSDIFHWLSQTITHHWARIVDIMLKNNNCKEVCVAILLSNFFISWWFLTKKLQLLRTCQFSISSSKHVHFLTLVLNTILILRKFHFQRHISCRHLNFDLTYEIGCHGDFSTKMFWKL